MSKPQ
jgi:phospholipid-translocating P-type ATPase (flippase)